MPSRRLIVYCWPIVVVLFIAILVTACGGNGSSGNGGGTPTPTPSPTTVNEWAWVSGSDTVGATGVYTTLGSSSTTNVPSARGGAVSWIDASGNLWLFGGQGGGSNNGDLNDLWEYSPTNKTWAWMGGSDTTGANGVYGTLGTPSTTNVPGARNSAVSWTDSSGNLWLFGGQGFASTGSGNLNDLWKFTPATRTWTWMGGSNTAGASGIYGSLDVPSATNVPGARFRAVSWTDSSGNFWLFGGSGNDSGPYGGDLNDLWMYTPTNNTWTWMGGSSPAWASGVYGTLGTPSTTNVPGARGGAVSWTDAGGNLWLFGGQEHGTINDDLNDLWEYSPTKKTWTWVSGSDTTGATGVYGLLGTPSLTNVPGARNSAVSWTDSSGNLWLFGGACSASTGNGNLNDLWEFNTATKMWTWMGGSNTNGANGVYGPLGIPSTSYVPGARGGAVSWIDSSGNFWLFGGVGEDGTGSGGLLNDLWRYQP